MHAFQLLSLWLALVGLASFADALSRRRDQFLVDIENDKINHVFANYKKNLGVNFRNVQDEQKG
jgi:hypothetical protein